MNHYMILYCLNKDICGWSERVDPVDDESRVSNCPECNSIALIYDKDQTDYIDDPTEQKTTELILTFGLIRPLPQEE